MAVFDAFLKLDGIKGESTDDKHKGEIDILSFSWGLSQASAGSAAGAGLGGGVGKAHFEDITITKKVDAATPLLFLNCANGADIATGLLTVRKAGGDQLEYLKIKLTHALIKSAMAHASEAAPVPGGISDEIPIEEVMISFQKIEFTYQPQGPDGKALGGPVLAGWDVKATKKV